MNVKGRELILDIQYPFIIQFGLISYLSIYILDLQNLVLLTISSQSNEFNLQLSQNINCIKDFESLKYFQNTLLYFHAKQFLNPNFRPVIKSDQVNMTCQGYPEYS